MLCTNKLANLAQLPFDTNRTNLLNTYVGKRLISKTVIEERYFQKNKRLHKHGASFY